jgi:Transposase DDE domain
MWGKVEVTVLALAPIGLPMSIPQATLNASTVREQVLTVLEQHFTWRTEGYRLNTRMTLDILSKAAVDNSSLEAVCADLQEVVDSNTVRESLQRALEAQSLRDHEREMNAALAATLPLDIPRRGVQLALDWHDEPFYGKTPLLLTYTCRAPAKAGTTHVLRLASVYLIWGSARLTLAVTYVLPEDETAQFVERLLQRVRHLGFVGTILYLDKGFCSGAVLRLLQQRQQKAVLACPIRGKLGGTKALCRGRGSYSTPYTFSDGTAARAVVVATCVPDGSGKKRRKWLLFVTVALDWSPQRVYQRYRRRFGIESSYRLLRQCRIRSNSRQPLLRFLLLGLALLLQNVWVRLRWWVARLPQRGPRQVDAKLLPFATFKRLFGREVERLYTAVTVIQVFRALESVVY